jgi:hypothetical protein
MLEKYKIAQEFLRSVRDSKTDAEAAILLVGYTYGRSEQHSDFRKTFDDIRGLVLHNVNKTKHDLNAVTIGNLAEIALFPPEL